MKQHNSAESLLGVIPSALHAIGAIGDAMPASFSIPTNPHIARIVQPFITRKEQIQGSVMRALPKGISEGLATKSAQGFALGVLSQMVLNDVKHHRENMAEVEEASRNAAATGTITVSNPLKFYVPRSSQEAVSTVLTHLNDNQYYYSMEQAEQLYNDIQKARSTASTK